MKQQVLFIFIIIAMAASFVDEKEMLKSMNRSQAVKKGYNIFSCGHSENTELNELNNLLKESCIVLHNVLLTGHHTLPFSDIFVTHKKGDTSTSIMDPFRAQCKYADIPSSHPVYDILTTTLELLQKSLQLQYGIVEENMEIDNVVILRSYPYGSHQETHLDMNVYQWGLPFHKTPFFGIVALQRKTRLAINWSATNHFRNHDATTGYDIPLYHANVEEVKLEAGQGVLVKVEVAHFGVGYNHLNFRIHFTLTPKEVNEYELDPDLVQTNDIVFFSK